jgi:hypothetical protein
MDRMKPPTRNHFFQIIDVDPRRIHTNMNVAVCAQS